MEQAKAYRKSVALMTNLPCFAALYFGMTATLAAQTTITNQGSSGSSGIQMTNGGAVSAGTGYVSIFASSSSARGMMTNGTVGPLPVALWPCTSSVVTGGITYGSAPVLGYQVETCQPGNNSGIAMLTESATGSPSWVTAPLNTVSTASKWFNSYTASTGTFGIAQPAISDLTATFNSPLSLSINTLSCPSCTTSGASLVQHAPVVGAGLQAEATISSAGTAGYPLVSGGPSADPAYNILNYGGGGTHATTAAAAFINLAPAASEVGDIIYCSAYSSGCTTWSILAGSPSTPGVLYENSSGTPSWSPHGTGTVIGPSSAYTNSTTTLSTILTSPTIPAGATVGIRCSGVYSMSASQKLQLGIVAGQTPQTISEIGTIFTTPSQVNSPAQVTSNGSTSSACTSSTCISSTTNAGVASTNYNWSLDASIFWNSSSAGTFTVNAASNGGATLTVPIGSVVCTVVW